MQRLFLCLALFGIGLYVLCDSFPPEATTGKYSSSRAQIVDQNQKTASASRSRQPSWLISPFGSGPLINPDQAPIIATRKQRMLNGGFMTPEKYFHMNVKELAELASTGDTSALLQLGERYWSEPDNLAYDESSNQKDDTHQTAIKYFKEAVRGGAMPVLDVMSKRLFDTGNVEEAAAWHLLAQRCLQTGSNAFFESNHAFDKLTYEQLGAAEKRAQQLGREVGIPYPSIPTSNGAN